MRTLFDPKRAMKSRQEDGHLSRRRTAPKRGAFVLGRLLCVVVLVLATTLGKAQEFPVDLTELSLEELMNLQVTMVSRKPEKLWGAPAAVFVITQDDIRRSGARSLPDVLRMAPGIYAAHIDANMWVVTIRGFAGRFANKLLVLIDGRSVYTPLFSGVIWETHDLMLEDIERIEVIRGPGATLWGANAVNGVINIITKSAKDTQGSYLSAGVGTEERNFGAFQYGGRIRERAFYRVYVKYAERDKFGDPPGYKAADAWSTQRTGFRIDWDASHEDAVTLQGDIYGDELGNTHELVRVVDNTLQQKVFTATGTYSGMNVLGRWKRTLSRTSELALQVYFDHLKFDDAIVKETLNTFDFDFQHHFAIGERNDVIWGLGCRYPSEDADSMFTLWDRPARRTNRLYSAFLQDEIALVLERLTLTVGTKLERNDYTGLEVQPNVRFAWLPHERHMVWGAVSRAVRTPSRAERTGHLVTSVVPPDELPPGTPMTLLSFAGTSEFVSEVLIAYELGYRSRLTDWFSVDLATFYNDYSNLRTGEPGDPIFESEPPPPHVLYLVTPMNKADGTAYGGAVEADFQVRPWWRVRGAFSYFTLDLRPRKDTKELSVEDREGDSPKKVVYVRSSMDLPRDLDLDVIARYVDEIPNRHYTDEAGRSVRVGSYLTFDVRLAWKPVRNVELSLVGQNLLNSPRVENDCELGLAVPTKVQPGVYCGVSWKF